MVNSLRRTPRPLGSAVLGSAPAILGCRLRRVALCYNRFQCSLADSSSDRRRAFAVGEGQGPHADGLQVEAMVEVPVLVAIAASDAEQLRQRIEVLWSRRRGL